MPDHAVSPAAVLLGGAKDRGQAADNAIDRASLPGKPGIGDITNDRGSQEIGREFPVTRERIRQIEAEALRKLKLPSRAHVMRSFAEP